MSVNLDEIRTIARTVLYCIRNLVLGGMTYFSCSADDASTGTVMDNRPSTNITRISRLISTVFILRIAVELPKGINRGSNN